jgi:hypothetical protein
MGKRTHGIPAASVGGVDITSIRRLDPSAAREIERIGHLLDIGQETIRDLAHLCVLLLRVGEREKAGSLLIGNSHVKALAKLLRQHFPERLAAFDMAIRKFGEQYSVTLRAKRSRQLMHRDTRVVESKRGGRGPVRALLARRGCTVAFRSTPNGLTADVGVGDEPNAIPMVFAGGRWAIDFADVGATWLRRKCSV